MERYSQDEDFFKDTETFIYVPEYHLGLEAELAKWLTGRIGAHQRYWFELYKEEERLVDDSWRTTEWSRYGSDFNMNIGLGFKFGNFMIDTVLEHDFLFKGPEFIGGEASGLATKISVNYQF